MVANKKAEVLGMAANYYASRALQRLERCSIGHEKLWLQEELHPTSWARGLLFVQGLLYNIEEKAPPVAEPSRDLTSLAVSGGA
jgi:hypothetical protein